jgi:hypothetical protein
MKGYKFYAHFNRVAMQRGQSKVWSLHVKGVCMQAESIKFNVPLTTRFVAGGRQPRATLRGTLHSVIESSDGNRLIVV